MIQNQNKLTGDTMKKPIAIFFLFISNNLIAQISNEVLGTGVGELYLCDNPVNPGVGDFGLYCTATGAGSSITSGDSNVFIGDNAGMSVSSGSLNTFVGESAGLNQTTASDNTFIGQQAGFSVTTGNDNTFIGKRAGFSNTASDGTFVGSEAGYFNTSGANNVFIGEEAGFYNTTGRDNVFVGEDAGYKNTDGDDNTAIGNQALRSNRIGKLNTAIGNQSGWNLGENSDVVISSRNTLVGNGSGYDIRSGQGNTMLGANAGENTEGSDFNTFVGVFSGWDNNRSNNTSSASRNTGLGVFAGYNNREGQDNVWLGAFANSGTWGSTPGLVDEMHTETAVSTGLDKAGAGDTTIYRTTVLGASSAVRENDGIAIGYLARTFGDSAIVIGSRADSNNALADFSIAIGASSSTIHPESIVLGYQTVSHAARTFTVGNANTLSWDPSSDSVTSLGVSGYRFSDVLTNKISVNATTSNAAKIDLFADAGASNDDKWSLSAANGGDFSISSFVSGVDVNKLSIANNGNVVIAGDLALNSDERLKTNINSITNSLATVMQLDGKTYHWKDKNRAVGEHLGFIAQEVEAILPNLVSEGKQGIKSVNYQSVIPLLTNAIKELNEKNDKQDEMIVQLQSLVEQQQALIIKLSK